MVKRSLRLISIPGTQTYIEKDVRLLKNIHDLTTFHTFLKLCSHRTGQLLNLSSLATDCGITHNTARAWVSLLEAAFIVFLLRPHYRNFNKRLIKIPKLYFYDTGLAAHLANIENPEHLLHHPLRGPLFECFVVAELIKRCFNRGQESNIYFGRDKTGHEIDCIVESHPQPLLVEIKSGKTITDDFFSGFDYYRKLSASELPAVVVCGGDRPQRRTGCEVLPCRQVDMLGA